MIGQPTRKFRWICSCIPSRLSKGRISSRQKVHSAQESRENYALQVESARTTNT